MPFQEYNVLLGKAFPFSMKIHFWSKHTLLVQAYPFGPKIPFQVKDALSGQACHFGMRMTFWAENALLGRKRQSTTARNANNNQPQQASWTLLSLSPMCALGLIN